MYVNVFVEVSDYDKLRELFRSALVDEFSPKTGINFADGILKMHLFFEETPPKSSIYSLCDCGTITYLEFNYSAAAIEATNQQTTHTHQEPTQVPASDHTQEIVSEPTEVTEVTPVSESAISSDKELDVEPSATSADSGASEPKDKPDQKSSKKRGTAKQSKKKEILDIPEIKDMAEKAASEADFLDKVHVFLKLKEHQAVVFDGLLKAFGKFDKPSWNDLIAHLDANGIHCSEHDKHLLTKAVQSAVGSTFWKFVATIEYHSALIPVGTPSSTPVATSEIAVAADDTSSTETADVATAENTTNSTNTEVSTEVVNVEPEVPTNEQVISETEEVQPASDTTESEENDSKQTRSRFTCMPEPTENETVDQALTIEENIWSLTDGTLEEKITTVIHILSQFQPTLFNTPGSLDDFIRASALAISGENVTFDPDALLNKSSSSYSEDAKQLRYCQLRWASLSHTLAKMYNPDFDVDRIKAQKFLQELCDLLRG